MLVAKPSQIKLIHIQKKRKNTGDVYTLCKFSNRELVATHARHFRQGFFSFFFFTPQWLVKKAIERKEEMGDYIREFSVSQFSKYHTTPQVNAKCLS